MLQESLRAEHIILYAEAYFTFCSWRTFNDWKCTKRTKTCLDFLRAFCHIAAWSWGVSSQPTKECFKCTNWEPKWKKQRGTDEHLGHIWCVSRRYEKRSATKRVNIEWSSEFFLFSHDFIRWNWLHEQQHEKRTPPWWRFVSASHAVARGWWKAKLFAD